jgi:hypothetical protein
VEEISNAWPEVILFLLFVGNVLAWQDQFVSGFG